MEMNAGTWIAVLVVIATVFPERAGAKCYEKAYDSPKGNQLYLYFPKVDDDEFTDEFYNYIAVPGTEIQIKLDKFEGVWPLKKFLDDTPGDIDNLAPDLVGSPADLRNAIHAVVVDDYCEFSVDVVQTTEKPSPTEARWQIIGIGADKHNTYTNYGRAQIDDWRDVNPQDYARVWAGRFREQCATSSPSGDLAGTNSTLARWGRAIGHTASHEAGHGYGVGHDYGLPRQDPGSPAPIAGANEDDHENHIMAWGTKGLTDPTPVLTCEVRAGTERHFSDTSYETLGYNIGLNISTAHNWDFINTNDNHAAHSMTVTLLSEAEDLTVGWHYTGPKGPWGKPTITRVNEGNSDKIKFQEKYYNVFEVKLDEPKSWNGDEPGIVPARELFHIGVTFEESDPLFVYGTQLYGSNGDPLPLRPRMIGYDVGPPDPDTGLIMLNFYADDGWLPGGGPPPGPGPVSHELEVRDLQVFFLPRLADINTMVDGAPLADIRGIPVLRRPVARSRKIPTRFVVGDAPVSFAIASMKDRRHVDVTHDLKDCKAEKVPDEVDMSDALCGEGTSLSLFPSTYVYVTATVVDPNARHFDAAANKMVTGPVESKLFFQVAGIIPDLNNNGVDDLLDIRNGTSTDDNNNGVPDDAEGSIPWRWIAFIVAITLVVWWWRRRRSRI